MQRLQGLCLQAFWYDDPYSRHQATSLNTNLILLGFVGLEFFLNLIAPSLLYANEDLTKDLIQSSSCLDILKSDRKSSNLSKVKGADPFSEEAECVEDVGRGVAIVFSIAVSYSRFVLDVSHNCRLKAQLTIVVIMKQLKECPSLVQKWQSMAGGL